MTRASRTPRIADLREAPVVGQLYLVPTVLSYPYHGFVSDWPVLGALHNDREHFNFVHLHYHVDARFLTARQRAFVNRRIGVGGSIEAFVNSWPLVHLDRPHAKGRPELRRRRCSLASYGFAHRHQHAVRDMQAEYGEAPEPIRKADGRLLCPHRKVDLSQFPIDAAGFVTCPLHGLRVRCAAPGPAATLTAGATA